MRITIKTTLISLFCMMSLIVAGLCVSALVSAYHVHQAAQEVTELADIDRDLVDGLGSYRFERGGSTTVLTVASADSPAYREQMAQRRAKVTAAIDGALAKLAIAADPALTPLATRLRAEFQTVKGLRTEMDTQLNRPMDQRDPNVARRITADGGQMLTTLEALSNAVEAQIQAHDPAMAQLILARSMAWATRALVGSASLQLNTVVGEKRPLTPEEDRSLTTLDSRAEFAWNAVRDIGLAANAPAALKAAVEAAQTANYGGTFKPLRDEVLRKVRAGQPSGLDLQQWRSAADPGQTAISAAVAAAVDSLLAAAAATEATARNKLIVYGVILAVAVILTVVGLLVVVRRVTGPISSLTRVMTEVADGDLQVEVPGAARHDEIGAMAKALLVFKDNLARTRQMEDDAARQRIEAEAERKEMMQGLASEFEREVGGIIGTVSTSSEELQKTASRMAKAAEKTSAQSTAVAAAAEEASTNVVMVASSAEELGSSVDEIARQVQQSAQMSATAVQEATKTGEVIRELAQAASRIGDVIGLISNIAEQTNLLALNATIEAARAGDAGKGFAVVASEVKALATQTAKATEDISIQITAIQTSTDQAVKVIEGVGQQIRQMSDVASGISAAVEEQGIATREIVRNVDQAATGTNSVNGHIAEVAKTADETGAAASMVLDASTALTSQAKRLEEQMERFLQTVRTA
ncbi:methyl-accepting chemotaxis protein [Azorhizobium doebereinerae]|uniref:methyl-accepting chemotaxis protein n=1 Tax=Azorhizobium doebereinerae TaxID=281091 RepID=UPI0004157A14|nr:HAMP domain-containing methyl-accepting chemotaxis protein [Azorhizobium doebereinerae]